MYLLAMHTIVSGALYRKEKHQRKEKICYALTHSKKYYSEMEKICYVVVMSMRNLRHYFEAYRVRVLTNQLLNEIFRNRDSLDRIGKWAMELSEHAIDFEKRSAIKSQVLVDFIAD
jgi:hypothetical protein